MEKKVKKQTKQVKKNTAKNTSEESSLILGMIKGLAIAYAITCIVFIVYALILTYTSVSEKHIALVAIICTVAATVVAGFDTARSAKSRGLLWGVLCGVCYALILFVIGILLGDGVSFNTGKITTLLIAAAGGGLGGILGINKK